MEIECSTQTYDWTGKEQSTKDLSQIDILTLDIMSLPLLPGNSFNPNVSTSQVCWWQLFGSYKTLIWQIKFTIAEGAEYFIRLWSHACTHCFSQIGRSHFHKSHAFDYRGDVPVCVGERKSGDSESVTEVAWEWLHAPFIDSVHRTFEADIQN